VPTSPDFVEKCEIVQLYTGNLGDGEMHQNFIVSERAGEILYVCSETTTYI